MMTRWSMTMCLLLAAPALARADGGQDQRVRLEPSMMTNEAPHGRPAGLVDEQDKVEVGHKSSDQPTGTPQTVWEYPSQFAKSDFPVSAYLDLGQERYLSTLWVYDLNSSGNLTISSGQPGQWEPVITYGCGMYKTWVDLPLNVKTRYLRFTREDTGAIISEVVLYEQSPKGAMR